MFLEEMATVFEDLECRAAYNLDGGHCSFMTYKSYWGIVFQPCGRKLDENKGSIVYTVDKTGRSFYD